MPMPLRGETRTARVCRDAALLCVAMAFSYLEVLCPVSLLVPIPGVKLGLANLLITAVFYLYSRADAAVISALRILLSSLLFGSVTSFFFSAAGGLCAFLLLCVCRPLYGKIFSFVGISVFSAAGHHFGQIAVAAALFGKGVFLTYFPVLLLAGLVVGTLSGALLNLCADRFEFALNKERKP